MKENHVIGVMCFICLMLGAAVGFAGGRENGRNNGRLEAERHYRLSPISTNSDGTVNLIGIQPERCTFSVFSSDMSIQQAVCKLDGRTVVQGWTFSGIDFGR